MKADRVSRHSLRVTLLYIIIGWYESIDKNLLSHAAKNHSVEMFLMLKYCG